MRSAQGVHPQIGEQGKSLIWIRWPAQSSASEISRLESKRATIKEMQTCNRYSLVASQSKIPKNLSDINFIKNNNVINTLLHRF
jgi:hypothetical protein